MTVGVISDRASLEEAAAGMMNRADLTDELPGFVRLAEGQFLPQLEVGRGHETNPIYREPVYPLAPEPGASNWLLLRYPNLYLYGVLMQAQIWAKDDQRAAQSASVMQVQIDTVNKESRRTVEGYRPSITHDHVTDTGSLTALVPTGEQS